MLLTSSNSIAPMGMTKLDMEQIIYQFCWSFHGVNVSGDYGHTIIVLRCSSDELSHSSCNYQETMLFATHGIPQNIVPPTFSSEVFKRFVQMNGIRHITSVPYHPATAGLAYSEARLMPGGERVSGRKAVKIFAEI